MNEDRGRTRRRGPPGQRGIRGREREVRRGAVALSRWAGRQGTTIEETAGMLGVSARSLMRWWRRWRDDRMELRPRGRPPREPDRETREEVRAVLKVLGPRAGLPALRAIFPEVARGALQEIQRRFRTAYRRLHRFLLHQLAWTRAGAVWAADFATPPSPVDGYYRRMLNARDLSAQYQLAALPTVNERESNVEVFLESSDRFVGLPLVLKVDNGSAFRSRRLKAWCRLHGVALLYSPRRTPEYNGAIEAGTGSMKVRAAHEAARHGRPAEWNCDDLEGARLQANATSRPWGHDAPAPDQVWASRRPIAASERSAFLASCARYAAEVRARRGIPLERRLGHYEQAAIDRVAIRRALVGHRFLSIRRRRITPANSRKSEDKIQ